MLGGCLIVASPFILYYALVWLSQCLAFLAGALRTFADWLSRQ